MKLLCFDTETTGLPLPRSAPLEKQPKIIELGIIVLDGMKEVHRQGWLINPGEPITAEITKITGITNEDLVGKPSFKEVWSEATGHFLGADGIVAHNLPFDMSLLEFDCLRIGAPPNLPLVKICTVQEFMHIFGKRPKLTELYEHFMGKPLAQTHRAVDDVEAMVEIMRASGFLADLTNPV